MKKKTKALIFYGAIIGFIVLYFRIKKKSSTMDNFDIIKGFEGLRLNAYLDSASIPTIGYGTTRYLNNKPVQMGDTITKKEADSIFLEQVKKFAVGVAEKINTEINRKQFIALTSLAYNIGLSAFGKSTLLKKVNENPNDTSIKDEFMKWIFAGGRKIPGLENRRKIEANLYFS